MHETFDKFNPVYDSLGSNSLDEALNKIDDILKNTFFAEERTLLDALREDYSRLLGYWKQGYDDPQYEQQYNRLVKRGYRLAVRIECRFAQREGMLHNALSVAQRIAALSNDDIKNRLELFVADIAMTSLDDEALREENEKKIYADHHNFMTSLFSRLVTTLSWSNDDAAFYEQLILSPTIDVMDAQQLVAAITLAGMNNHDEKMLLTLGNVFLKSSESVVRQRALVGFAFMIALMNSCDYRYYKPALDAVMTEDNLQQFVELQKQIIYCMSVDEDQKKINEEIMPTLMENQKFRITRNGIEEIDESSIEDIINPNAEDRRMEELEEKIESMRKMQKSGSDIYFGGFSHMKRYQFFYTLTNWFVPYYSKHPELEELRKKLTNTNIMDLAANLGALCDSDRYSFLFGLARIYDTLPKDIKEVMLTTPDVMMEAQDEEFKSETFMRRSYLQNCYRFFRLYPEKVNIKNPFEEGCAFFLGQPDICQTYAISRLAELGLFFLKHKCPESYKMRVYDELYVSYPAPKLTREMCVLMCRDNLSFAPIDIKETIDDYFSENPGDDEYLEMAYLRALMGVHNYEEATERIHVLLSKYPRKSLYLTLNLALAYTKTECEDEALKILYRLDYEHPDDISVKRLLAWTLMLTKNIEKAEAEYATILASDGSTPQDCLNAGYCYWFLGNRKKAIELLGSYAKDSREEVSQLSRDFDNDYELLSRYVSGFEEKLMIEAVQASTRTASAE